MQTFLYTNVLVTFYLSAVVIRVFCLWMVETILKRFGQDYAAMYREVLPPSNSIQWIVTKLSRQTSQASDRV